MSSFCAYLTATLHISDPIAWLMTVRPRLVATEGEVERWTLPGGSVAYPLGANGFLFRKADLEAVGAAEQFQDTHVAMHLMQRGQREWIRLRGRGVHHYYVQDLWPGFLHKRRRAIAHYFNVRLRSGGVNWSNEKPRVPGWLACLYAATVLGPLWHTLAGIARTGDRRWLWHAPASFVSALGTVWGWWTFKRHAHDRQMVSKLQPRQTLKADPASNPPDQDAKRRVVCFVNGIYSNQIGGGDTYFFHIARAIIESGHPVRFFGGHALREFLEKKELPLNLTLTDGGKWRFGTASSLGEQLRLLLDFTRRFWGSLFRLGEVRRDDIAYGMSDFWFDAIPLVLCRARAKVMYLGMMAPTLRQVVFRKRPDVPASRLASFYYWASQQLAWRLFRCCRNAVATYSHPEMKDYLLRFGYREEQLALVANGMDVGAAERVPEQPKAYDVVWTGRVHPQKGIEDLLATLAHLAERIGGFRAVIIGNSRAVLEPRVNDMGLERHVTFTGIVTEEEKFRVIKSSRLFLMPSRYESWGIVVGEALASGVPVLAYDLGCYRPVFGDLVRYVECFNLPQFEAAAEEEVRKARAGKLAPDAERLARLRKEFSWPEAKAAFQRVLASLPSTGCRENR